MEHLLVLETADPVGRIPEIYGVSHLLERHDVIARNQPGYLSPTVGLVRVPDVVGCRVEMTDAPCADLVGGCRLGTDPHEEPAEQRENEDEEQSSRPSRSFLTHAM
ncbi:hypothetical protein ACF1BN_20895 [Streptomyces sp. NPDC014861]|uniref:hypothetical protein n=1 Tax=Streptomyces sp. NPDC014861 TaxID=3364923 RepID=UPI0036FE9090